MNERMCSWNLRIWGMNLWSKALTLCCCSHPRRPHTHLVLSIQGAHLPLTTSSSLGSENSAAASNWLWLLMPVDSSLWNAKFLELLDQLWFYVWDVFNASIRLFGNGSFSICFFSPKLSAADFHVGWWIECFCKWVRCLTWAIKCRLLTCNRFLVLCLKVL